LLGKILRIDVRPSPDGKPYRIPQDNPFVGMPGVQPEIWAYGFREPWRFAFDALTQELWVGDVGQDRVEEVAVVMAGENHGWNVMEGFEPFSQQYRREGENYVAPVFAYHRDLGNSVTGGQVYRAEKTSPFYGMYVFGDYTSRRIWALAHKERRLERIVQIGTSPMGIASFATDAQGEVYLVGYEGMIYRLELESLASTL
jgi:glucose/arabinose dehydrogenase